MEGRQLLAETLGQTLFTAPAEAQARKISVLECEKLVEGNPDLVQALESAMESRRYHEILSLPGLTREDPNTGREVQITGKPATSIDIAMSVAWKTPYYGKYPEVMLKNINDTRRGGIYSSFVEIVQSSGTGKSRMVHELASSVFTIPFNLRHPTECEAPVYPPGDTQIWKFLCDISSVEDVRNGQTRYALFFTHVFAQVTEESGRSVQSDLAHRWREYPSGKTRDKLYNQIVKACEQDKVTKPEEILRKYGVSLKGLLHALEAVCAFPNSQDVRILLYFDEAHELHHKIPNQYQPVNMQMTLHDVLRSLLNHYQGVPIFTISLSTQSSFPAYIWSKLEQLEDLAFLARFGRPLFWTLIEAGTDTSDLIKSTMDLARTKLINSQDIGGNKFSSLAMLAILDVLITIDYEPRESMVHEYETDMIASHMRIAFSIPQDRASAYSGYPSEPFLAEAASRQTYQYLKTNDRTMAKLLEDNLEKNLIDLSRKGEIVMCLLLRMAHMSAICVEQPDEIRRTGAPNFSKSYDVLQFLKALFAEGFHGEILKSQPDNHVPSTQSLEDAFKHAVVRFTHFIEEVDESVMSTKSMVGGFVRGAAFICRNKQESVDIIIPIFLDKRSSLEESLMSALLIQVKRQRKWGSSAAHIIDQKEIGFFPNKVSTGEKEVTRPYITLMVELGANDPPKDKSFVVTGGCSPTRATSKSEETHPRYSIQTYGCTEMTWKVVRSVERDRYKRILATDDFLADHPRQDEASLNLVRQMLPFMA
ncbi:hypothetical protein EDC04DRAFT_2955919 [Pisolithus marmoratus]|nr:hypothetical protein EDC04DRAFT_2955919 [Pisolithus marmoratus]